MPIMNNRVINMVKLLFLTHSTSIFSKSSKKALFDIQLQFSQNPNVIGQFGYRIRIQHNKIYGKRSVALRRDFGVKQCNLTH